uniref:Uncharacterized protein n=1 Tax=Peronospora matthiolae TaxID=2874970 RepID=A0AAV1T4U9_9STRA
MSGSLEVKDDSHGTFSSCGSSAPEPTANQTEADSEQSEVMTDSPVLEAFPSTSSSSLPATSTTTDALLPRLRPTAPVHCVVPNCCDFFTSPHPHYPKEVVGMTKSEECSHEVADPADPAIPDTISDVLDNERGTIERDVAAAAAVSSDTSASQPGDEFEMWDYVCPQYARRFYASEWV